MRLKAAGVFAIAGMLFIMPASAQPNSATPEQPAPVPPASQPEPAAPQSPQVPSPSPDDAQPAAKPEKAEKPDEKPKTPQAAAQEDKQEEHKPADPDTGSSTLSNETLGLVPNPLQSRGIKFSLSYVGETLGNVSGGLHRGAIYDGRLNAAIDVDFQKLAGWQGLTFHANVFQIHGPGLSRHTVGNLISASSIEALDTTRLYEMWFEQKWSGERFSIRAGQLAADTEFITTKYADVFINATYGWPTITAINLPSGGPSPPLAAVGARFKANITEQITWLSAVFDGDQAGPGLGDPQARDRYGLNFRVNDPPLFINEIQYAYNHERGAKGLPGTFKLGSWVHAGTFNDQRFASNGLSQANPAASSMPAQLHSDYGIYTVWEQQLLSFPGGDGSRGLGVFTRVSGSPSDRNLIDFYADGGLNLAGPFDSRPDDKIGVGFAYANISPRARDLDRDFNTLGIDTRPVRDHEALFTLGYLMQIRQGWNLYPTFQYVIHPGGGYVLNPPTSSSGTPTPARDAAVFGVRTTMKF